MSPERIKKHTALVKRLVVKVGTRLLVSGDDQFDRDRIRELVRQIAEIRSRGIEVILVSSGAIGAGMKAMGLVKRPTDLASRQALAAIGQALLVQEYEKKFERHGLKVAQVLLSVGDLGERKRFLNARRTMTTLLEWGIVPIVNENDTVAVDEIRFGDNDFLAAVITGKVSADLLIILTDIDGLYDGDPKADGVHIPIVDKFTDRIMKAARGPGGETSMGGMRTKVEAARLVAESGKATVIANGREKDVLINVLQGAGKATWFLPGDRKLHGRKLWLAMAKPSAPGRIEIDDGAARVVQHEGRSLLPIGVRAVHGRFVRGDLIRVCGTDGGEIARGLSGFDAVDLERIKGRKLTEIASTYGQDLAHEVIHRDNLVVKNHDEERRAQSETKCEE